MMAKHNRWWIGFIFVLLGTLLGTGAAVAMEAGVAHRVVIQVSDSDDAAQAIALNNAVNLQKHYGMDNVAVEIVAYGPGLSLLIAGTKQAQRVESLAMQNITFSACGNTMERIAQKEGKPVVLSKGVQVVQAGVARITELQEQGYAYIRP